MEVSEVDNKQMLPSPTLQLLSVEHGVVSHDPPHSDDVHEIDDLSYHVKTFGLEIQTEKVTEQ